MPWAYRPHPAFIDSFLRRLRRKIFFLLQATFIDTSYLVLGVALVSQVHAALDTIIPFLLANSCNFRDLKVLVSGLNYIRYSAVNSYKINPPGPLGLKNRVTLYKASILTLSVYLSITTLGGYVSDKPSNLRIR